MEEKREIPEILGALSLREVNSDEAIETGPSGGAQYDRAAEGVPPFPMAQWDLGAIHGGAFMPVVLPIHARYPAMLPPREVEGVAFRRSSNDDKMLVWVRAQAVDEPMYWEDDRVALNIPLTEGSPKGMFILDESRCISGFNSWQHKVGWKPAAFPQLQCFLGAGVQSAASADMRPTEGFVAPGVFAVLARNGELLRSSDVMRALEPLYLAAHWSHKAAVEIMPTKLARLALTLRDVENGQPTLRLLELALELGDPECCVLWVLGWLESHAPLLWMSGGGTSELRRHPCC